MMTDRTDIEPLSPRDIERYVRLGRQLQAEAVRASAVSAYGTIKLLFSNRKAASTNDHADANLVCGHV
ncbi:MAG: hypothetical protein RIC16_16120 [Rhodospirillales bacterium]